MGKQNGTATWKTFWQFLIKLNIPSPYNTVITLLGIYPKELTNAHKKIYMWMFIEALFTIAKTLAVPNAPSVGDADHGGGCA